MSKPGVKEVQIDYRPRAVQREIHEALSKYRWSVIVAHRRLGKTVCMVNELIRSASLNRLDKPRYAYIAPQYKQAKTIAWDYLKHFTAPIPGIGRNEAELWVELPNSARIRLFGADNPDALRGIYLDGVVMDEVAQMRPETWGEIIFPTLVDRNGWACFIGTPKGLNLFSQLYFSGLRKDNWFTRLYRADETGILSPEDLAIARDNMTDTQYRQEMLCDFGASGEDALIPLDIVNVAVKRDNPPSAWSWAPIVFGVDVARFGDDNSVIYVRQGLHTVDVLSYQGLDLMEFADKVAASIRQYIPARVYVDSVGIGAGLVDRLRQMHFEVLEVNGASSSSDQKYKNKRAECWGKMREWLRAGGDIPDRPALIADLSSLTYSFDVSDRLVIEKKSDARKRGIASPDEGDALSYTFAYPMPEAETRPGLGIAARDWRILTGENGGNAAVNMEG